MLWSPSDCYVSQSISTDVLLQSSRFCWATNAAEATCSNKVALQSASLSFLQAVLDNGHVGSCWPILLSCLIIFAVLQHQSATLLDEVLYHANETVGAVAPLSQLAKLLVQVEVIASADPAGLSFEVNSFDLRAGGLPFFSVSRSARQLLRFHRAFQSAHLGNCNGGGMRGTFSLKSIPSPEVPCSAPVSDRMRISRCNSRKLLLKTPGINTTRSVLPRCPASPESSLPVVVSSAEDEDHWMRQKWQAMFDQGWCEAKGLGPHPGWLAGGTAQIAWQRCSFHVIMDWILPPPGGWFLDWGSACGHKLVWAKQFYGLHVVGVEYQRDSVAWARRHAPGVDLVCHGDGRDLTWLPDDFFDGALAFGAMNYLSMHEQCDTVLQIAKKLKPGARAVIGYNSPGHQLIYTHGFVPASNMEDVWARRPGHMIPPHGVWQACLQKGGLRWGVSVRHDVVYENLWYFGDGVLEGSSLSREGSYALLITRL